MEEPPSFELPPMQHLSAVLFMLHKLTKANRAILDGCSITGELTPNDGA